MLVRTALSLLSLVLFFTNCESPQTGCLDVEATNFDVSKDKACEDDCCKYPNLVLTMNQEYNGVIWKENQAYQNDLGQLFFVQNIQFYVSNILVSQAGTDYHIADSLRLDIFQNNDTLQQTFTDDFLLIKRTPVNYTAGTFRKSGFFDQVQFDVGLDATANKIVPSGTPSGHPLRQQADSLWLNKNDGFTWMRIILKKDTITGTDSDTLRFTAADFGGTPFHFAQNTNLEHTIGFDFYIPVTANFAELFKGINFANSGVAAWKSAIISNLNNTFAVIP